MRQGGGKAQETQTDAEAHAYAHTEKSLKAQNKANSMNTKDL